MTFEIWKASILKDIREIGFRATYRKYGLSSASLRNIVNGTEETGKRSWERLGRNMRKPKNG